MVTLSITTTDDQALGLTFINNGAYPTNQEFLQSYLNPLLDLWFKQYNLNMDSKMLKVVKGDPTMLKTVTDSLNTEK